MVGVYICGLYKNEYVAVLALNKEISQWLLGTK